MHHMFVAGSKNFGKLDHLFQRRISVTGRDDEMLSHSVLPDANPVQGVFPLSGVPAKYAEEFNTVPEQFTQKSIVMLWTIA